MKLNAPTHCNAEVAAYVLSHDLRAPLRAIEGFTRALAQDLGDALPPAAAYDLREIQAGIGRMQAMLTRWLGCLRNGVAIGAREHVDLSSLGASVIAELQAGEPQRTVEFTIESGLSAEGDAVLLRQLLQNLLGNAWKFTRGAARGAAIELSSYRDGALTVFTVRDNGVGFAPEHAKKIFEPFTSLHAPAGYEGTGIGLAIARNIVQAHGGRIWADRQPDGGAVFSFTLPDRAATWSTPPHPAFDCRSQFQSQS